MQMQILILTQVHGSQRLTSITKSDQDADGYWSKQELYQGKEW
jgi:hypothetical protein